MNVRLELGVEEQIEAASDYYDLQELGLGSRFEQAVRETFRKIGETPTAFPIRYNSKRRAIARPYPYLIYFEIRPDYISVLGIVNAFTDPYETDRKFGE